MVLSSDWRIYMKDSIYDFFRIDDLRKYDIDNTKMVDHYTEVKMYFFDLTF
jgi:hypothetical protein